MNNIISVKNLSKSFKIYKHKKGFLGSLKNLFSTKYDIVKAVDNPPFKNRKSNARNIGVVFGQRTQLWWDLPLIESFDLLKNIYKIPKEDYNQRITKFIELLDMKSFINTPVRKISLGQRMRGEIVSSLLHNPKILYLDEPTIGLDIVAKNVLRKFIIKINKELNTTIILTTHDIGDIEKLCKRIIVIDYGKIIIDGNIDIIHEKYNQYHILEIDFLDLKNIDALSKKFNVLNVNENKIKIKYYKKVDKSYKLINEVAKYGNIVDFKIHEPELENIIRQIYKRKQLQ